MKENCCVWVRPRCSFTLLQVCFSFCLNKSSLSALRCFCCQCTCVPACVCVRVLGRRRCSVALGRRVLELGLIKPSVDVLCCPIAKRTRHVLSCNEQCMFVNAHDCVYHMSSKGFFVCVRLTEIIYFSQDNI